MKYILSFTVAVMVAISFLWLTSQPAQAATIYGTPKSQCLYKKGMLTGYVASKTGRTTITNKTTNCTFTVGSASYRAYLPYTNDPNNKQWIFTQTYNDHKSYDLGPGRTVTLQPRVDTSCAWQVDAYVGSPIIHFTDLEHTYSGQGTYLSGWYETTLPMCKKVTPTPTPTPTPTKIAATCPSDTVWVDKNKNGKVDNNECEKPATIVCPSDTVWLDKNSNGKVDNAECERPVISTCPSDTVWVDKNKNGKVDNNECEKPATIVCPSDTVWVDKNDNKRVDNDECQKPILATCPSGSIWVDDNNNNIVDQNECQRPVISTCPSGSIWVDENNNQTVDDGECQKPVLATCPAGTVWVDKNGNKQADQGECQTPGTQPTPTPTVLGSTPVPLTELPSTGPGAAVVISLIGLTVGLMAKKHHLLDNFGNHKPKNLPDKFNHQS